MSATAHKLFQGSSLTISLKKACKKYFGKVLNDSTSNLVNIFNSSDFDTVVEIL